MKEEHYKKVVEDFRHYYFMRYNVKLDDELLYIIIRINEMHLDLKKEIRSIERIEFRNGWDYFVYGLGKWLFPCLALLIIFLLLLR
jgi:hypothetical protein